MAQYIQKPGGGKFTLKSKGFTTLQEAADAGWSPVSAPTEPHGGPTGAPTTPAAPITPALNAVETAAPVETTPAAFTIPAGYEKISGAKYPTTELQQGAYGDIRTDPTKTFLYGKPTEPATPSAATPATDAMAAAGEVKPEKTIEEKQEEAKFALERERVGTESPEDIANLDYMRKQGWIPAKEDTPSAEDETIASTIAADFGLPEIPSIADLITNVLSSTEYQYIKDFLETKGMFAEAGAEAAKEILERKYESDKTSLENNLAGRGLAFSGIRGVAVRGLTASLASSTLDIDRKLAEKILDLDKGLMDTMMDMVGDLIDEANKGRSDAISQLNKAGFAVINGTLVPTMEARREARAVETAEAKEARELLELNLRIEKAGLPNIKFEVANGRKVMITYDDYGNILETKDLGSAYKATGAGKKADEAVDPATVNSYVNRIQAGEIKITGVPSGPVRGAVVIQLGIEDITSGIEGAMADNASVEEIEDYIKGEGYKPEDFSSSYAGYAPDESAWYAKGWVGKIPFVK